MFPFFLLNNVARNSLGSPLKQTYVVYSLKVFGIA